jgi:hypothetical protein
MLQGVDERLDGRVAYRAQGLNGILGQSPGSILREGGDERLDGTGIADVAQRPGRVPSYTVPLILEGVDKQVYRSRVGTESLYLLIVPSAALSLNELVT